MSYLPVFSLAVGDNTGRLEILDISESYHTPKPDEWSKFMQVINEMTQASCEERKNEAGSSSSYSRSSYGRIGSRYGAGDYWFGW